MAESTIYLDFDIMNYYKSIYTATKALGSYLESLKEYTGYTWDRIAQDLSTTKNTINKIRYAVKPVRISTYIGILERIMDPAYPKPKGFSFSNGTSQKNVCYKCHPDCPFISLYPRYRSLNK